MIKLIQKINIEKIFIIFFLLQPIVDLITSLSYRFFGSFATIGVLVKGMFLAFLVFYVLIKYKFSQRKPSTIFLIIFLIYEILYLLFNCYFKSNLVFASELKGSIKAFFVPIVMVLLYDIFKNEKINIKSRYLVYIILEYALFIVLANITGTSFNTYEGFKTGTMGWYYSGNDIGAILISLFPILYFYSIKRNNIILYILLFLIIYSVFNIGTKVPVIGVAMVIVMFLILAVINYIFKRNKMKLNKNLLIGALSIVFIICLIPSSSFYNNLKIQYSSLVENKLDKNDNGILDQMIFSGRSQFKKDALERYNNSNIYLKLFGMGYLNESGKPYKLVERDHYDLFFNQGVIGALVYSFVILYIISLIIRLIMINGIKELFRMNIESYAISIVILLGTSVYSGHILLNPTVGIYFSIIFISLYFRIYNLYYPIKVEKNNKVTIMALHLKPGGVEKFISTTSKFLTNNFDVEIVCVYNYDKSAIVDVDEKVTVKYLLPNKYLPNKDKIKNCLKNKKFISALKECFIAVKILILKRIKMIKYIKNCDSGVIISTRIEHNSILSEYANKKTLKIATEHNYYETNYSKKVVNSCADVDYFIVSTLDQKSYYEELFKGLSVTVIQIPFALENIPKKSTKMDNYKLISVGRLSKEKGYIDMIDIFKLIVKKDSRFKLKIIGYGPEKEKILKKINEYKIENNVELCGQKKSSEIQQELLNSSLFLMTSYTESFGIVLIEAMSCGVPCIIFDDAKGACEIIKNDFNGYIIKNRNKDQYAKKIINLFENKTKLKELGKNSKEYSSKFKINNIKSQWLNIINK